MEEPAPPGPGTQRARVRSSALGTLACLAVAPPALAMLAVGGAAQPLGLADRRITHFLLFQALSLLTLVLLRVIIHCIIARQGEGAGEVPGQGMVTAVSYTLCFFLLGWAVRFTPEVVGLWLALGPACPSLVHQLALAYCSIVSGLVSLLTVIFLAAILAGLLHPEFLVVTGFLNQENVLIDFAAGGDDDEDKEEKESPEEREEKAAARWRKAYAVEALLGGGRALPPAWAALALAPIGIRPQDGPVPLPVSDTGSSSPYLRKALDNSFRDAGGPRAR